MGLNPAPTAKSGRVTLAEINVTPMVDVMLVLLIVFMVSAPLLQQGVEVNLPKADSGSLPQSEDPVVLTIRGNQTLELDQKPVAKTALFEKLTALAIAKPNLQVLVEADQSVSYGVVAKVMAQLKKAKIARVGLVTAPESPE
ncbi:MAG: biopolymer transporter ExbD [Bdellovibrionales bacterium]|nr:biopolymer transporter ExbD [Bdellovibrionales bacterium]